MHAQLMSPTKLQNKLFHVVERTKTFVKLKIARAKRAKLLFFIGRVYTRGRLRRLDVLNFWS